MINFSSVKKVYGGRTLFSEVTFSLGRGERCGIVGRNGSGKSTLFRLITGEESSDGGDITFPKHYRIGTLQQHLSFDEPTILSAATSSLPPERRDEEYKAEIILTGLGFSLADMDRSPSELSGGFQLRLQLAKVLVAEPDCLLLDEPTNYLDIVAIRWLEDFLRQWPGELMLISHDRSFVDSVVTSTLGIYREKVRKLPGDTEKFYTQMLLEDEIHERTRQRADKKRAHMQSFVDRFGAKATKAAQAKSREKAIAKLSVFEQLTTMENLDFSFRMAPFPGTRMLECDDLSFSYDTAMAGTEKPFGIEDFALHIEKGDRIAIIGKNGRGKSTLLSLLAGLLKPQTCQWWRSDNLRIGHFGQTNIQRLHPDMTVEEEVTAANPQLPYSEVRNLCGLMMFSGDAAKKTISVLSGGERSRVLLGKILAAPCNLLLLDEPTHHLDMESVEALFLAVRDFPGAVIIVTHDESLLDQFADTLVICRESGVSIFDGDYSTFLRKEGWEEDGAPKKNKAATAPKEKPQRTESSSNRARKIKKCEDAIVEKEALLAEAESLLEEATATGDIAEITKHSTAAAEHHEEIERLFHELDALS